MGCEELQCKQFDLQNTDVAYIYKISLDSNKWNPFIETSLVDDVKAIVSALAINCMHHTPILNLHVIDS